MLAVCEREQPDGVVIQFGGQTPLKLAHALDGAGFRILGTPLEAIDLAEDRERFAGASRRAGHPLPGVGDRRRRGRARWRSPSASATRCSCARRTCSAAGRCGSAIGRSRSSRRSRPARAGATLVDRFLEGALEIDVDALCDGRETYVAAVMEHVEEAGVHSGDSSCALPAPSLDAETKAAIEELVSRLAPALGVVGLVNVQLAIVDGEISVLEANPRASRTVPVREQGDGRQPRRGGLPAHGRSVPVRPGPVRGTDPAPCLCQGCRVSVRAVPRVRPRARPGDALDGRGDGDGGGLRDRVRARPSAPRGGPCPSRARSSSPSATRTSGRSFPSPPSWRGSASRSSRQRGRPARSPTRASTSA